MWNFLSFTSFMMVWTMFFLYVDPFVTFSGCFHALAHNKCDPADHLFCTPIVGNKFALMHVL
jgi:hypothetical protein